MSVIYDTSTMTYSVDESPQLDGGGCKLAERLSVIGGKIR